MQSWIKLVCLILIVTMMMMTMIPLMYLKVSTHLKLNVCIPKFNGAEYRYPYLEQRDWGNCFA